MSIQTELARIKGAKADLQSWVEENGVTVPDGTLIDGLVELAKTVETGDGGGINATAGTITVSSDVDNYVLTHGLGEVPKFFVIGMIDDYNSLKNKNYILIGAYGFSDVSIQYRISTISTTSSPSGVLRKAAINDKSNQKASLLQANEETILVANSGATMKLIAGATYYWVAVGSGVF